jgi:hypothetical protein
VETAQPSRGQSKPEKPSKEIRNLRQQEQILGNLNLEGLEKIMTCKVKNTRKLLHLDFIFKLYMPLWCLEIGHKGKFLGY